MVDSALNTAKTADDLVGAGYLHAQLKLLPNKPGVYRMTDAKGEVLYVGKAKSLKKRVSSYARPSGLSGRIQRMVALTRGLEVITTGSEVEALLLEANLIKRYRPPFNIVLRDDKSFPYIVIGKAHDYPQLTRLRGSKRKQWEYFGPFASSSSVNETLNALLRAFQLRSCPDSIFANRSRPCLQYQIKRCTAPCVGRISAVDYAQRVEDARAFLAGRSQDIQDQLKAQMLAASEAMDFEQAAAIRDRIRALANIASKQGINTEAVDDADVIAMHREGGRACVQVFFYRAGRNNGNRAYFPSHTAEVEDGELLDGFLGQFYAERVPPRVVLLSHDTPSRALVAEALAVRAGRKVELLVPKRGEKRLLIDQAVTNARQALARNLAESSAQAELLRRVADAFDLGEPPRRIEVYDNSHIMGTNAVGAFVVAGPAGLDKAHYRKFNIKNADLTPGDDYAMMREVLTRRFTRLLKEDPERDSGLWPDLVVIDGGLGQLHAAQAIMGELGLDDVALVAIAKGPDRNAGREVFHLAERAPFMLDAKDPVLYFLQRLRDEAHRFAISSHRARRAKSTVRSKLDGVPGVGGARKKALLSHFGSVAAIERAGLRDLEAVPGINKAVARAVYDHFHESG
ncbi:MAG: excinuclease ABC subunit UvrC [Geminicoccaceae bacterium]